MVVVAVGVAVVVAVAVRVAVGMIRRPWTSGQLEILRKIYPNTRTSDMVEMVEHPVESIWRKANSIGLRKSPEFLSSEISGRLVGKTGIESRFQKGHATWNKGMKGLKIGGEETQFKKGNIPRNHKPVGTVVIRTDGYSQTKIAEPNVWELTHRLIWRLAGNDMPVYPEVLRFKDRNPLNCTIENLELSSKVEMMEKNSVQTLPPDLRKAIHLHGVLIRKINGN